MAHHLVIAEVTNLTVEAWPISPPFPVELRNSTVKQTATYNNKLNEWAQEYFYAIPFLQRRIAVSYSNMHYNETLQAIYRGRSHPSWVSDEVGYHKLSLSFLYRISVPTFCCKLFIYSDPTRLLIYFLSETLSKTRPRISCHENSNGYYEEQ